jgi:hypothetical protein
MMRGSRSTGIAAPRRIRRQAPPPRGGGCHARVFFVDTGNMRLRRHRTAPPVGTPVTLRESRVRLGLLTGAMAILAAAGGAMIATGDGSVVSWGAMLGFGAGALMLGSILVRGGRALLLDNRGFMATTGFPRHQPLVVVWEDVTRFSELHFYGQSLVGIHLRPGAPPLVSRFRRFFDQALVRDTPDGTLPSLYGGMSARELISYLDRWRGHAADLGNASTTESVSRATPT